MNVQNIDSQTLHPANMSLLGPQTNVAFGAGKRARGARGKTDEPLAKVPSERATPPSANGNKTFVCISRFLSPTFNYAWFETYFGKFWDGWPQDKLPNHVWELDLIEAKKYHESREFDRRIGRVPETFYNEPANAFEYGTQGAPRWVDDSRLYKMSDEPALISLIRTIDSFAEHMTRQVGVTFKVSLARVRYVRGNDVPETGMGWHKDRRGNNVRNLIVLLRDAVGSTMFLKDGVSVSCAPDARGSATYFHPNVQHSAPLTPEGGRLFVVVTLFVAPWEEPLLRVDEIAAAENWSAV